MRTSLSIVPLVVLACTSAPVVPDAATVVESALPAVVLIVNEHPDGTKGWGTGAVVGNDGLILTNNHVVRDAKRLRVLFHHPGRPTYTPLDGGLERLLFESERELVDASIERVDAALDVAALSVTGNLPAHGKLEVSTVQVRPGDSVMALGHPEASVWSFTAGIVSRLHRGAIQHDAPISPGSSGGPLLDAHGRLIGVNTSKMFGDAEGIGFARPIELAQRVLQEGSSDGEVVDRSAPTLAALSCIRAQELGSEATIECYDWDWKWQKVQQSVQAAIDLGLFPEGAIESVIAKHGGREAWEADARSAFMYMIRPGTEKPGKHEKILDREKLAAAGVDMERYDTVMADLIAKSEDRSRRWMEGMGARNGLSEPLVDAAAAHRLIKGGIRVERVKYAGEDLAWVEIGGRNPGGSKLGWSELYRRRGVDWKQLDPLGPEEMATLPSGWWPPLGEAENHSAAMMLGIMRWTAWHLSDPAAGKAVDGVGGSSHGAIGSGHGAP